MGAPKASLRLPDGRTFSEAALEALSSVCDEVVVLGHGEGCPAKIDRIGDAPDVAGPLGGITALLRSGRGASYLVASCDMPFLSAALLRRLVDAAKEGAAVLERETGAMEPLPLFIPAAASQVVEELVARGERRLLVLAGALGPCRVRVGGADALALANLNAPEDLVAHGLAREARS